MKPVLYHRLALLELEEAIAYYDSKQPGLGLDLLEEVNTALERMGRFPSAFPLDTKTNFRKVLVRRFPYVIFFREQDEHLWIAAVAHQKRKPGYWLSRQADDS